MQIFVKSHTGKTVSVSTGPNDSISSLKKQIQKIEGIPVQKMRLTFQRKQLVDNLSLSDYKIKESSTIHTYLSLNGGTKITFQTSSEVGGQTISLSIDPSETIKSLLSKIQKIESLKEHGLQIVTSEGFIIDNDQIISELESSQQQQLFLMIEPNVKSANLQMVQLVFDNQEKVQDRVVESNGHSNARVNQIRQDPNDSMNDALDRTGNALLTNYSSVEMPQRNPIHRQEARQPRALQQLDPSVGQDSFSQITHDSSIQNSFLTPFNKDEYAQAIHNPLTKYKDYEVITVRRVRDNIKFYNKNSIDGLNEKQNDLFLRCSDKNGVLELQKGQINKKLKVDDPKNKAQCFYCDEMKRKDKMYRCEGAQTWFKQEYYICFDCQTKAFVRRKIKAKTSQHGYYIPKSVQVAKDPNSQTQQTQTQINSKLMEIVEQTRTIDSEKGVDFHDLGEIVENCNHHDDDPDFSDEYAVIGFWQVCQSGELECYREFNVNCPLYHRCKDSNNVANRLLWFNEQGQVYFFSLSKESGYQEVVYTEIDIAKAMRKGKNFSFEEISDGDSEDKATKQIPTLTGPIHFEGIVQTLLQQMFNIHTTRTCQEHALILLHKDILSITCPNFEGDPNNLKDIKFDFKSFKRRNYVVIDLKNPSEFRNIIPTIRRGVEMYENKDGKLEVALEDVVALLIFELDALPNYPIEALNQEINLREFAFVQKFYMSYRGKKTDFKSEEERLQYQKIWDDARKAIFHPIRPDLSNATTCRHRLNKSRTKYVCCVDFYFTWVAAVDAEAEQVWQYLCHDVDKGMRDWAHFEDPEKFYSVSNPIKDSDNLENKKFGGNEFCQITLFDLEQENDPRYLGPNFDIIATSQNHMKGQQLRFAFPNIKVLDNIDDWNLLPKNSESAGFYFYETKPSIPEPKVFGKVQNLSLEFRSTLLYRDSLTQETNMAFICGQSDSFISSHDSTEKLKQFLPQNQPKHHYMIKWPILIQNSGTALQNKLLVSNFQINQPQTMIDLGCFRFVCFVDSGMKEFFTNDTRQCIFFLASIPETQILRLMVYRYNPWPASYDGKSQVKFDSSNLEIVSGEIDLSKNQKDLLRKDHIVKACLFYQQQDLKLQGVSQDRKGIHVLLQFKDKIVVYQFDKANIDCPKILCNQQDEEMLSLQLVRAPYTNQAYYVKRTDSNYQVMLVYSQSDSSKIDEIMIYQHKQSILSLQFAYDKPQQNQNETLYLFTEDQRFIELKTIIVDNSTDQKQLSQIQKDVNLKNSDKINKLLQHHDWHSTAISSRQITLRNSKSSKQNVQTNAFIYNLKSQQYTEFHYFGFETDLKQLKQKNQQKEFSYRSEPVPISKICTVQCAMALPNIGKIMFVVQEGDFNYLMVQQSFDNKQFDSSDEWNGISDEPAHCLLDESIAVNTKFQKVLIFSQFDFMLKRIEHMEKLLPTKRLFGRHKPNLFRAHIKDKILDKKHNYTIDFKEGSTQFEIIHQDEIANFDPQTTLFRYYLWGIYLLCGTAKTLQNDEGDIGLIIQLSTIKNPNVSHQSLEKPDESTYKTPKPH